MYIQTFIPKDFQVAVQSCGCGKMLSLTCKLGLHSDDKIYKLPLKIRTLSCVWSSVYNCKTELVEPLVSVFEFEYFDWSFKLLQN